MSTTPSDPGSPSEGKAKDWRLYIPHHDGWVAQIKTSSEKDYCYSKNPGEDYFHLIVPGEIHLRQGHDVYCLNCAIRMGIISTDRLFWQNREAPENRPLI